MAFYLLQEDGVSKITLEDGTGFVLLEEGSTPPVVQATPYRPVWKLRRRD